MWVNRLVKIYKGISISGVLLALVFLVYILFQGDGFVFALSIIGLCVSIFVAMIDIQSIRLAQKGKTGMAIILALFWIYYIFSTLTSTDHQWQSRLINYIVDTFILFKVITLMILIIKNLSKNKKEIQDEESLWYYPDRK